MTFDDFLPDGWRLLSANCYSISQGVIFKHKITEQESYGYGNTFDAAVIDGLVILAKAGFVPKYPYDTGGLSINEVLPEGVKLHSIGSLASGACLNANYVIYVTKITQPCDCYTGHGETIEDAFLNVIKLVKSALDS